MKRLFAINVLLILLIAVSSVCADVLILKDGRKFSGKVVLQNANEVHIMTAGGLLKFSRREVVTVLRKINPKKVYKRKKSALESKALARRMKLAQWCADNGLPNQAHEILAQVLLRHPGDPKALKLLSSLTRPKAAAFQLRVEIALTDGSRVKGRLVNPSLMLETPFGLLRIPTSDISEVQLGDGQTLDTVETTTFKAQGRLLEQSFVVISSLGKLTITKKNTKTIRVYQPTPEEAVEIEFETAMRKIDHFGLDVVFVVDCTDSMDAVLKALRSQQSAFTGTLRKYVPNTQFGLVAYRDHRVNDPDEYTFVTKVHSLTADPDRFAQSLASLRAVGGGDIPEAVFDGLLVATTKIGWRKNSHRLIFLLGDAPPHRQNGGLRKTLTLMGNWHKNTRGVLHAMDTTGYNKLMDEFRALAKAGGGKTIIVNDEKTICRTIIPLVLGNKWEGRFLKTYDSLADK